MLSVSAGLEIWHSVWIKFWVAACVGLSGVLFACGNTARDLGKSGHGGSGPEAGGSSAGAIGMADIAGMGGTDEASGPNAGASNVAGAAGGGDQVIADGGSAGSCGSCTTPPRSTCKDATTLTSYAESGTCTAGSCSYAAINTACSGATPSCEDSGTSSQCAACLADVDCNNGGTCSSAGACVCGLRFNGSHCEFQAFRGIGVLSVATDSEANNVSHDGTVVVGSSFTQGSSDPSRAVRSVNGAALQFMAEPSSITPGIGCFGVAVAASGTILMNCERKPFLYTPATGAVAVALTLGGTGLAAPADISADGKVIVGNNLSPTQQYRHANGSTSLLGVLSPGDATRTAATNSDGSVVVGNDSTLTKYTATRWSASSGLVALQGASNAYAYDVTPDGNIIVGRVNGGTTMQSAVKWSGATFKLTVLGPGSATAVNADGTVIVGIDNDNVPTMWDHNGAHSIVSLLGATPDLTPDWTLKTVTGISDDGKVVVGNGTHGTHAEGWVAHLP